MTLEQLVALVKDIYPSIELAPITVSYGGKSAYSLFVRGISPATVREGDDLNALISKAEADVRADVVARISELEAEVTRLRTALNRAR